MLLEMKVAGLTLDPTTQMPILILKDLSGEHPLPIWIGALEASAIATELEQIQLARPMTHDLVKNVIDEVGARLLHIEIKDLRENTYFAALVLQQGTRIFEVDARPSDAIAIALRAACPIRVEEAVLSKAQEIDRRPKTASVDDPADVLSALSDEEFGKWKM
jgi:uncharacterized protein